MVRIFADRLDAGRRLAEALAAYRGRHPLVLAIPRGAVQIGAVVADALEGELDVVLVRKLRSPISPEYAVGAVDESGWTYVAEQAACAGGTPEHLAREKRVQMETLARRRALSVGRFMIVFGLTSTLFDLITFAVLLKVLDADEPTFQTVWFVLSLLTEVAAVLVLRTHGPAWKSRPGGVLLATAAAVALAALVLPYTGQLAAAMGFVALSATTLGASLLIVLGYIVATEATKQSFYLRAPAP